MPAYFDEKVKGPNKWYSKFNYTDWQGNTKTKFKRGFKLKRDADKWERSFLDKIANAPTMLFGDMVAIYLKDHKSRTKESTNRTREQHINKRILPTFKDYPINAITPLMVRQWQAEALTDCKPTTQKMYCVILKSIFDFACKFCGLQANPCTIAGNIGKSKPNKSGMQIWTIEQFNSFLDAILTRPSKRGQRHKPQYYVAFFTMLFYSGLRIGEALALNVGDFVNGSLYISKSKNPYNQITPPKTEKANRLISLPPTVCALLEEHINNLQDDSTNAPLFPKLARDTVAKLIDELSPIANIPAIRIHDLRHSHASMLINAGVQPLAISERLGHEDITTTLNTYSHLYKSTAEAVADTLENIIANKTVSNL